MYPGSLVRFHLFARYMDIVLACIGKVYSHRAHHRVVYTVYTTNRVPSVLFLYDKLRDPACCIHRKDNTLKTGDEPFLKIVRNVVGNNKK